MRLIQQVFDWAKENVGESSRGSDARPHTDLQIDVQALASPTANKLNPEIALFGTGPEEAAAIDDEELPPVARPLPGAVANGVFGWTDEGPIVPDDEALLAITTEHSHELQALLIELGAVQDAVRNGCDPRTGKPPRKANAAARLEERCRTEEKRLKLAYEDALGAYVEGFGQEATELLDQWVRKSVAGPCATAEAYEPSHPWHYLAAGDGAAPCPVTEIPADDQAGRYLEADLPKNPKKRLVRIRELLNHEREQMAADKQRYLDVIERGVEALSRYDREIAYSNPEIAVASTLALKYRHISLGLGRIAWLQWKLTAS